jgi:hypothetical protein
MNEESFEMARKKTEDVNPESELPTTAQPAAEQAAPETEEKERNAIDQFIYHQRRALEEASKAVDALLPEGFKTHGAEAQKEFNKGFKVLVDAAIAELEKINRRSEQAAQDAQEGDPRPSSTGKVKVKVQVE